MPSSKDSVVRKALRRIAVSTNKKKLLSFEENPYISKESVFMRPTGYSSSAHQSPMRGKISFPFKSHRKGSFKGDAQELMEFIELEDFCRRSTVADSKTNKSFDQSLQANVRNSNFSNCQEKLGIKKTRKEPKKSKKKHHTNHLVKTMAITICPNSQIIYG